MLDMQGIKSTIGYFMFVGDNLVTWWNKKQDVVPRFSVKIGQIILHVN